MKEKKISHLAIVALVLAIISIGICWFPFIGLISVITSIILGFVAKHQIHKNKLGGQGLAVAAIIIGFLLLIPSLIVSLTAGFIMILPMTELDETSENLNEDFSDIEITNTIEKEESSDTQIYSLGDTIKIDDLAYTIHSYKLVNQIGDESFGYFFGEEADGIFLIADVTIENIGKESKTLWTSYITIIDDQGRTYEHDSMAEIYLDDSFDFEQLQPGLPKSGKIVFDVPADLKGFFKISSDELFSSEEAYVSF